QEAARARGRPEQEGVRGGRPRAQAPAAALPAAPPARRPAAPQAANLLEALAGRALDRDPQSEGARRPGLARRRHPERLDEKAPGQLGSLPARRGGLGWGIEGLNS